jgi:hypothetical protein
MVKTEMQMQIQIVSSRIWQPTMTMHCWFFEKRKSELKIFMAWIKNRVQGDSTFNGPTGFQVIFWFSEKLDYKSIRHTVGGSYEAVHKCK